MRGLQLLWTIDDLGYANSTCTCNKSSMHPAEAPEYTDDVSMLDYLVTMHNCIIENIDKL